MLYAGAASLQYVHVAVVAPTAQAGNVVAHTVMPKQTDTYYHTLDFECAAGDADEGFYGFVR